MTHELIRYRPEYISEVGELLTEFWPDPAENAAVFSWMLEQNPYTADPLCYLLLAEGKLVGMRAFHGARWEIVGSGQTFDAPCACMFVIGKSARGRGLAQSIMKDALKDLAAIGYPFVFSFSSSPIPYLSQLRRGWRLVDNYSPIRRQKSSGGSGMRDALAKQVPLLRTLSRFVRRRAAQSGQVNAYARLDALGPAVLDGGTLSVTCEADAPAMARLASAVAIPGMIRHLRDPAYFAWRYKNPRMDYRIVTWTETTLQGFLVLQTSRKNPMTVNIIDWEVTGHDVLKRLFGAALDHGQFPSMSIWSAGLPAEMAAYLNDHGFELIDASRGAAGYSPGLLIKSLADSQPDDPWEVCGRNIEDATTWDLRPAFSDAF
jgi:GNAT superfamily N-acetyltransferase